MTALRVQAVDDKYIRISGINPFLVDCLLGLPGILEQRDQPAVRQRLLPNPTAAEEAANAEWQRLLSPDLRHLFVSAGETVARDLTALEPEPRQADQCRLTIPAAHVSAWMSALNQARLILGALHAVTEADMNTGRFDPHDQKHRAIVNIHVLGYLLHLFVELSE